MNLKPEEKIEELLDLLGYTKIDDDTSEMGGNKLGRLVQGARLIENQAMRCKMVNMTPEERKKQELIMKERDILINEKNELVSKCRHVNKFLLGNVSRKKKK